LQRKQALNFRISLACFLCSGNNGPRLLPTRFSVASFFPFEVRRITGLVALAVGLFLGPEFLRVGGEDVLDGVVRLEVVVEDDALIGTGGTAAAGLIMSWL